MSLGLGAPFPVSTSDFKLIRKIAHLVLQWCMNSTDSSILVFEDDDAVVTVLFEIEP
jgi:hypothetical protein